MTGTRPEASFVGRADIREGCAHCRRPQRNNIVGTCQEEWGNGDELPEHFTVRKLLKLGPTIIIIGILLDLLSERTMWCCGWGVGGTGAGALSWTYSAFVP